MTCYDDHELDSETGICLCIATDQDTFFLKMDDSSKCLGDPSCKQCVTGCPIGFYENPIDYNCVACNQADKTNANLGINLCTECMIDSLLICSKCI